MYRFAHGITLLLLLSLALPGCKDQPAGETLTSRIQYDVPIVSDNPQLDWWVNNIEGSRREPLQKRIMAAAESGEVKIYDYFNNPMTPAQLKAQCIDTIYRTLTREFPPYEEYDTMVVIPVEYRDITKVRFLEEWRWDPQSLSIEKKVIGMGPLIQREVGGEQFNQLLFWIYFDEDYPEE